MKAYLWALRLGGVSGLTVSGSILRHLFRLVGLGFRV